ncbi:hypothetical protein MKX01_042804 [Papaver californicum]|nr:hypothetical protein MKX01_042804 [Papaver californicum]
MDKVSHPLVCNESLVCDILSRLPVKSLMRFKCVCKPWQSLIKNDRHFIDLHFTRSNTAPTPLSILIGVYNLEKSREVSLLLTELLLPSDGEDEHEGGGRGTTVQRKILGPCSATSYRLLNGLICYIDRDDVKIHRVCIHNPSTRESTSWVSSMIREQYGEDYVNTVLDANGCAIREASFAVSCEFGYDPATKEHKVVSLWGISKWDMDNNLISDECVCEVWTVGSNSWRRIDDYPRYDFVSRGFMSANYANGSIYWLDYPRSDEHCIIEFNVGRKVSKNLTS